MNVLITKPEVEQILNVFGNIGDNGYPLEILNLSVYQLAMTHKSFMLSNDIHLGDKYSPQDCNERLEFLGDSFVGAVVGKYLFDRFETSQEGFLTKLRTRLVRSSMMYRFARVLGLGKYLLISQQMENMTALGVNKGRFNPRLYEDIFEAFVGAIIADFGDETGYRYAKRFIINVIENLVDFSDLILVNENFKDIYQRYFQSMKAKQLAHFQAKKMAVPEDISDNWLNPVYIDLDEQGSTHMKLFTSGTFISCHQLDHFDKDIQKTVYKFHDKFVKKYSNRLDILKKFENSGGFLVGISTANKKLTAEQNCSKQALLNLNINLSF